MKQIFVKDLKKEMEVIDFFMVKSVAVKTGSTGKPYLDVVLGDNTGEINGKKWDVGTSDHLLKEKDIVKIIAVVTEFNSQLQLKIQRIRKAVPESNPDDIMDMGDFVKAAPEDPEEMYDYIFRSCDSIKDEDYRKLCLRVLEDNREKLMYYPAASKNHHAELGGLLYHTKRMLMNGERVCQVYTNLNKDLVIAGGLCNAACRGSKSRFQRTFACFDDNVRRIPCGHCKRAFLQPHHGCDIPGDSEDHKGRDVQTYAEPSHQIF